MTGYLKMMKAQSAAEIRRTLRNRRFVIFGVLMPILLYFVFTASLGDNMKVDGTEWKLYYLISMTVFGIIGSSLYSLGPRISQERSQGWARWLRTTPLPNSAYLISKIVGQALIHLAIIVIMFSVGILVKGIDLPFYEWLAIGAWLLFGMIPFLALGTLLGTFNSPEVVQIVVSVLQMMLGVFGGLWFPVETMPDWMQKVAQNLPSFRFGQGAWDIAGHKALSMAAPSILILYTVAFLIMSVWRMRRQRAEA